MNLNVPISELQKHKLFIATPMYGGACFGSYTKSLLDLSRVCSQYGIAVQFSFIFNESLITRARNYLADEFMQSDCTHLMFIDSDIDFNPLDVVALLAIDKPIIGGPYPKKTISWENVFDAVQFGLVKRDNPGQLVDFCGDFVFNVAAGTEQIRLDQPVEVQELGTGFLMIKRETLTAFHEAYPDYWYTPDHNRSAAFNGSRKIYQYFQAEIEKVKNRYLSEDYWFCQKARECGQSVWMAPWMQLKHHGSYIYSGSIPAMATVVDHRIKNNIAPPVLVPKTQLAPSTDVQEHPMTVEEFNALTLEKKQEVVKKMKEDLSIDKVLELLVEWVKNVPDLSIQEMLNEI